MVVSPIWLRAAATIGEAGGSVACGGEGGSVFWGEVGGRVWCRSFACGRAAGGADCAEEVSSAGVSEWSQLVTRQA